MRTVYKLCTQYFPSQELVLLFRCLPVPRPASEIELSGKGDPSRARLSDVVSTANNGRGQISSSPNQGKATGCLDVIASLIAQAEMHGPSPAIGAASYETIDWSKHEAPAWLTRSSGYAHSPARQKCRLSEVWVHEPRPSRCARASSNFLLPGFFATFVAFVRNPAPLINKIVHFGWKPPYGGFTFFEMRRNSYWFVLATGCLGLSSWVSQATCLRVFMLHVSCMYT